MFMNGTDKQYMKIAIDEAEKALDAGDFPTGAVLLYNGKIIDSSRNSIYTDKRWDAHSEHKLLSKNSNFLMEKYRESLADKNLNYDVSIYTTLEPCIMCFGMCVMHRVRRIISACEDPYAGHGNVIIYRNSLYDKHWPLQDHGAYRKESCDLIIKFSKTKKAESWEEMLKRFEIIRGKIEDSASNKAG